MSSLNSKSIHQNLSKEEKIEALFREQYVSLCNGVNQLLRDESLSEDLVQEVFIKVWEKKESVDVNERFIFYLKRSCYHAALKYLSSKSYRLDTETSLELPDSRATDEAIRSADLSFKIKKGIASLPEKTQLIFTLSRYEELTYKEIAKQLDLSIKSVEKHMGKALKILRATLKEELNN